jgi:hypothetical protein
LKQLACHKPPLKGVISHKPTGDGTKVNPPIVNGGHSSLSTEKHGDILLEIADNIAAVQDEIAGQTFVNCRVSWWRTGEKSGK